MITLDGSQGEGGGQILRSALALSLVTGRPFRISRIRARRPKPGLMRQHLACVEAAARIGSANVEGAMLGSTELTFQPGVVEPGSFEFKIGSAGSTMLLLQTILPPLMLADRPSELVLEGGTHNPFAPPFPFIDLGFLPLLRRIGFNVEAVLDRPGFYPNGGGSCLVSIQPATALSALTLEARILNPALSQKAGEGEDRTTGASILSAHVCLAGLPRHIGERELAVVHQRLTIPPARCAIEEISEALGPGNTIHLVAATDGFAEVFTGFGAPRVRAEQVAEEALAQAEAFLVSGAAVDEHLANQLLLPLALARGGSFVTTAPSEHTRTNAGIVREFLQTNITMNSCGPAQWRVTVEGRKSS
ncbi:MAG TPA: RNA 3'-terminal phosphate cyclase [Verrucomicrobiota bacterium]|nr:RNA 3'-terminal phosphate cyclase [Verrucomicrobiota bacterium]